MNKNKFFEFHQNNSGGSFYGPYLIVVEAADSDEANLIACENGVYFDGVSNDMDCPCCGDRWHPCYDGDGEDQPLDYGRPIREEDIAKGRVLIVRKPRIDYSNN